MRIRNLACSGLCLLAAACSSNGEGSSPGTTGRTSGSERAQARQSERAAMQAREEGPVAPGAEFDPGRTPGVTGQPSTVVSGRTGTAPGTTGSAMGERGAMDRGDIAPGERAGVTAETRGGAMDMDSEMEMEPGTAMQDQPRTMPGEPMAQTEESSMCPADIQGLNVRVTSIPSGGAMVFTAATDQVDELRMRLRRFADMHQQHTQGGAEMPSGATGRMRMPGSSAESGARMPMPGSAEGSTTQREHEMSAQAGGEQALIHQASEVRVIEIPRGARLEIRMTDQQQVRPLRAELREDAEMLRNGNCPVSMQASS